MVSATATANKENDISKMSKDELLVKRATILRGLDINTRLGNERLGTMFHAQLDEVDTALARTQKKTNSKTTQTGQRTAYFRLTPQYLFKAAILIGLLKWMLNELSQLMTRN